MHILQLLKGGLLWVAIFSIILLCGFFIVSYQMTHGLLLGFVIIPLIILLPIMLIHISIDLVKDAKEGKGYTDNIVRLLLALLFAVPVFSGSVVSMLGFETKLVVCGDLASLKGWGDTLIEEYNYPMTGKHIPEELWPEMLTCIDPRSVDVYTAPIHHLKNKEPR